MTNDSSLTGHSIPRTMSIGGTTFDLFVRTDVSDVHDKDGTHYLALPLGGKVRVKEVISASGGGANNTSVGLKRLGCDASIESVIADDQWGELLLRNFQKEGVQTDHLTIVEHETSSFSVILSASDGERVILYDTGANRHLHDVTFDREAAATMDCVYLNHIHMDTAVIENDLIALLTESPSIFFAWNPGGRFLQAGFDDRENEALLSRTNLLLLNKQEALMFAKTKTVRSALHILSSAGSKVVCITDGKNGAHATDGAHLYSCPAPTADVVDTTGAGDAFGTAMTWALLTGKDLPNAMRAGTINAMSVVGVIGAQAGLLTQTQMQSRLESTHIDVAVEAFQST